MLWEGTYPPEDKCCGAVRHASALQLRDVGVATELLDNVVLVLGELVANAIRHAHTEFTAGVDAAPTWLRVEVFDTGSLPPVLVRRGADATSGRGLHIVSGLCAEWGWHATARDGRNGKTVWAEFTRDEDAELRA